MCNILYVHGQPKWSANSATMRFFIDMSAAETKFNVIYYQLLMQHS